MAVHCQQNVKLENCQVTHKQKTETDEKLTTFQWVMDGIKQGAMFPQQIMNVIINVSCGILRLLLQNTLQYHTSSSLLEVSESESLGMVVLFCASDWDSDFESDAELVRRRLASARNP